MTLAISRLTQLGQALFAPCLFRGFLAFVVWHVTQVAAHTAGAQVQAVGVCRQELWRNQATLQVKDVLLIRNDQNLIAQVLLAVLLNVSVNPLATAPVALL